MNILKAWEDAKFSENKNSVRIKLLSQAIEYNPDECGPAQWTEKHQPLERLLETIRKD